MDGSCTFVGAAQGVVHARRGQQLALGGFSAEGLGSHRHLAAQGNAVLVLEGLGIDRCRLAAGGQCDRTAGIELLGRTMAQGGQAVAVLLSQRLIGAKKF